MRSFIFTTQHVIYKNNLSLLVMNSQFGDTGKSRVKSKSRKQTSMFITMLCNREGLYLSVRMHQIFKESFLL